MRELWKSDWPIIERFCYKREKENLFVFWNWKQKNCFEINKFFGLFKRWELVWLAVYFWTFKSFVLNVDDLNDINKLVDYAISKDIVIKHVPVFKTYWDLILERLKFHWLLPKNVMDDLILTLDKNDFIDYSTWLEVTPDIKYEDQVIQLQRVLNNKDINLEISDEERKTCNISENVVIIIDWKVVSKATFSWESKNYFQIIWVITDPKYRNKWYWIWVMSALCKYYFNKWIKNSILFTDNDNVAALKIYDKMWFKTWEEFILANF